MTDAPRHVDLPPGLRRTIEAFPVLIVVVTVALLKIPATRPYAKWWLRENHPVEIATFVFLFLAGVLSVVLALRARSRGNDPIAVAFFLVFALGTVLTALEEIAWGQFFFGFEPPAFLRDLNVKGETTLHNIRGLDGRTEILRVLFALGGFFGLWLARFPRFESIAPPVVLRSWFAVILVLAGLDLANDLEPRIPYALLIWRINELVEMLVGLAALIFVSIKLHGGASPRQALPGPRMD